MAIPLGRGSPRASRDQPERPVRKPTRTRTRPRRSYSVLLPVGFAVPPPLPGARCALTAPFHPCPQASRPRRAVCSLWHFPWGRPRRALPGTVLPWSPDFPPPPERERPSDRPVPTSYLARRWPADKRLLFETRTACREGIRLGRQDSNLRMPEPKSGALPLGDAPSAGVKISGGRSGFNATARTATRAEWFPIVVPRGWCPGEDSNLHGLAATTT